MPKTLVALALTAGLLMAALSGPASATGLPGPLVSVDWLDGHRSDVVVLDVRKDTASFTAAGHIPGAVLVDWAMVRGKLTEGGVTYDRMLLDKASFEQLMQTLGVDNDSAVVIAHGGKSPQHFSFGSRLYWQLKYYGHDGVALLDGGTAKWQASGRPLSQTASAPRTGSYRVAAARDRILATTEDVEAALADGSAQLVDSRPLAFYLGLEKRDYVDAYGHIPGATSMPFSLLTSAKGPGVLRSEKDLRHALAVLGLDPDKPVITYCNSGFVSAATWIALHEVLGNENVRLYDGSLHAWTKEPTRPMVATRVD